MIILYLLTMIVNKKQQWKKRVELMQFFYACLIKDLNSQQITASVLKYKFDVDQNKIINFFAKNIQTIKTKIKSLLKSTWTWERLGLILRAISCLAYCEFFCLKLPKAIVIDQALVTCDLYSQSGDKSFLNAILDKLLV